MKNDFNNAAIDAIANEVIWYSEKSDDGRYIIPISVDFDFTLTSHSDWETQTMYENEHSFDVLKMWEKSFNCKVILNTMRCGDNLDRALRFISERGLSLYGIGTNPIQESSDEISHKIFSVFDIDDKNVGVPLIEKDGMRPYVDWYEIDNKITPMLRMIYNRITDVEEITLSKKREVERMSTSAST